MFRASRHAAPACTRQVVVLAALAILAACSSKPTAHVIALSGTRFTPLVDTIAVGDTVVWQNDDLVPHTATANDASFDSGQLEVGRSWRFVPRAAGTHAYRCQYHPGMVGTLIVR